MKIDGLPHQKDERRLKGIGVSAGLAIGPAFVIDQNNLTVPDYAVPPSRIEKEVRRFLDAVERTKKHLGLLRLKAQSLPDPAAEEVTLLLEAYGGMLSGSRLLRGVEALIRGEKINAEAAIQRQIATLSASFANMGDAYLASRVADVREVGARLIRHLLQQNYNPFVDAPVGCLLIAEEITPADTALMDPERIAGFAAVLGGAEGHAAIMARAMALPAVLGVGGLIAGLATGDTVIIDGFRGEIIVRPTAATLAAYRGEKNRRSREARRLEGLAALPAVTQDGTKICLSANLELPREATGALAAGADGIGLLRTEFMFMNRPNMPTEDEQFATICDILRLMDGRPVTVRTLDVGGEKLASALGVFGACQNPALGLRAIRLGLREPKILETQLAAILRAAAVGNVRILVPMVSSAEQMTAVRGYLLQVDKKLRRRGVPVPSALPPLGAMIEIPGAALAADALAKVCDFFSIGSNDLTQYTLAIDRGDEQVADLYDPYHPGVLRLIQFTIAAAWRANIPVSLCGEMGADPKATPLLLGLGLRDFSMAPARLARVKEALRSVALPQAIAFAEAVMAKNKEADIRALLDAGPQRRPA
jgi:phosphotransferase system enzyme I (PtsI)